MRRYDEQDHQADRLRRRLQARRDEIEKSTRLKISPFTLVSILIILVLVFIFRGNF